MTQYFIKLCIRSEIVDCIPLQNGEAGLGLDRNGITWLRDDAPVRIEVIRDELHLAMNSEAHVSVVRSGRVRALKLGQAVRILADDVIRVDGLDVTVESVLKSSSGKFECFARSLKKASCAAMISAAAAFSLSACDAVKSVVGVGEDRGRVVRMNPFEECRANAGDQPDAIKKCCLELDESARQACCAQLEAVHPGTSCLDVVTETANQVGAQPVHGAFRQSPCAELTNADEIRSCCNEIEDASMKAGCCIHLERHYAMKCDGSAVPEAAPDVAEMPLGRSGGPKN